MVLYTPNRNLPYVQPADTVTTYPVTSQDLATKLDAAASRIVLGRSVNSATLASGTPTVVAYDVVREIVPASGAFSNAAGTVTIVQAGTYMLTATAMMTGGVAAPSMELYFYSAAFPGNGYSVIALTYTSGATMTQWAATGSRLHTFAAGATVNVQVIAGAAGHLLSAVNQLFHIHRVA